MSVAMLMKLMEGASGRGMGAMPPTSREGHHVTAPGPLLQMQTTHMARGGKKQLWDQSGYAVHGAAGACRLCNHHT